MEAALIWSYILNQSDSMNQTACDTHHSSAQSSTELLRELVAHLRQNRTQLREEWVRTHR